MKAKIIMLTAIMCIMLGGCGFEVQDIATINNDIEKAFKAVTVVGEIIETIRSLKDKPMKSHCWIRFYARLFQVTGLPNIKNTLNLNMR